MSGNKLIFNTRERAVSDDQNRLQAFRVADAAEVLRRLVNNRASSGLFGPDADAGNYSDTRANDTAAIGTPTSADVFDGLTVRPQPSSLNLLIDPGVVGLDDPDGQTGSSNPNPPSPDDSRYKVVYDPGIATVGALTIGAGSGSTRVDIVECQRVSDVLETSSRDIFDPSTGTVVPATVNKVAADRLTYRVRAGTPGGGLPARAQGWLPLCVAVVPSTATNVDGMTFWDVRPLVKDRVESWTRSAHEQTFGENINRVFGNGLSVVGKTTLNGFAAKQLGHYRAGGALFDGAGNNVDVNAAAFKVPGFTPVAGDMWNLVAIFPAALPRWVRYNDSPATRIPNGPKGVLAITAVGPDDVSGTYASVTPPTASGLPAGPAVQLVAGLCTSSKPEGIVYQDGRVDLAKAAWLTLSPTGGSPVLTNDRYDLAFNNNFPANARSVFAIFDCLLNGAAAAAFYVALQLDVVDPGGADTAVLYEVGAGFITGTLTATPAFTPTIEIPIMHDPAGNALSGTLSVVMRWIDVNGAVTSRTIPHMTIVGWRL